MFLRILNFLVANNFLRKKKCLFTIRITVILAFLLLNENPFRTDQNKLLTSFIGRKSGFVDSGFVKTCDELIKRSHFTEILKIEFTIALIAVPNASEPKKLYNTVGKLMNHYHFCAGIVENVLKPTTV